MNGILIPFLPAGVWLLAMALMLLLIFILFGYHIYQRSRMRAMQVDAADVATLASRKQTLQADVDALRQWMVDQKIELERIKIEREEQEHLRADLNNLEQKCAAKEQENQSLRNEVGELENQRHLLGLSMEKLEKEIGDLEGKREEAQQLNKQLNVIQQQVEEAQKTAQKIGELEAKLTGLLKILVEKWHQEAAEVEQEKASLESMRKDRAELEIALSALRQEQNVLEREVARCEEQVDQLDILVEKSEHAKNSLETVEQDLKRACQELAKLDINLNEKMAQKTSLEIEIKRLEGQLSGTGIELQGDLSAYDDLLKVEPACLNEESFNAERPEEQETTVLQKLKNELEKDGLFFSPRVVDAFHTSLKCHDISPLTVLAGVSGTGKTLLPMRYAECMGMHRLVMAVQPRWDSPQDMFGFYNYLERKYKASELSRSLIRMDTYNYSENKLNSEWAQDRLLLVLLDEMNLARTEYYFSEFLSKLELRREVKDPTNADERSQAEIELDSGPGAHKFRIWVGQNVFFVGTMNEDETTQTLSDKVLDRANVLRFSKPDENVSVNAEMRKENENSGQKSFLSFNQWQQWKKPYSSGDRWHEEIQEWGNRLNAALDKIGRPFGFRVYQAMQMYIANYPLVNQDNRYKLAFADQVEQKIIPKLRGIDVNDNATNATLNEVAIIISQLNDPLLEEAFRLAREESRRIGMFQWRGVTRPIGI